MASDDPTYHPERRIRFDGTITAGNLLTVFAMGIALLAWGFRLEGRVDVQERVSNEFEKRLDKESTQRQSIETDIKQAIRDVSAKLDRLIERTAPSREQQNR